MFNRLIPLHLPSSSGAMSFFSRTTSSETYIIFTVSFGLLVDMATYGIMVPVLPFRLHDIGYHQVPAASSYLIAAFAFGLIASSIPIGILGELIKKWRIPLKIPLLVCLLFLAGSLILFWLSASFPVLMIARILQGFSGTGIWTLGLALICETVPEHRIGTVMGYVMIGWSIGTVIGPLAGGLLYDSLGYHSIFVFALIITGLDFVMRLCVSDSKAVEKRNAINPPDGLFPATQGGSDIESSPPSGTPPHGLDQKAQAIDGQEKTKEIASGLATQSQYATSSTNSPSTTGALTSLLFNARVWTTCAIVFVLGFGFGGLLDSGMTLTLHARYGLNARGAGLVFIGAVIPSFVSSPLAGHFADKYGARWPTIIGLILGTPFFGLLSMEGSLATFIVWVAMTGLFVMAVAAPLMQDLSEVVKITPGLGYAHVYGIFNMVYSTGSLIGPLVVGAVLERLGIEAGWKLVSLLCALLTSACIIPAWLYLPNKTPARAKFAVAEVSPDSSCSTAPQLPQLPAL